MGEDLNNNASGPNSGKPLNLRDGDKKFEEKLRKSRGKSRKKTSSHETKDEKAAPSITKFSNSSKTINKSVEMASKENFGHMVMEQERVKLKKLLLPVIDSATKRNRHHFVQIEIKRDLARSRNKDGMDKEDCVLGRDHLKKGGARNLSTCENVKIGSNRILRRNSRNRRGHRRRRRTRKKSSGRRGTVGRRAARRSHFFATLVRPIRSMFSRRTTYRYVGTHRST